MSPLQTYTPQRIYKGARRHLLRIRDHDQNPYATHMPVLATLGITHAPMRSVLELGSGPFSTALFLNRDLFPDLEQLVSYEDDAEWANVVKDASGGDPRLDFRVVPAVRKAVPDHTEMKTFDLIFIDDSQIEDHRAETIRSVIAARPQGIVVIHDFEVSKYRRAARGFDQRLVFRTFTPQVGVCWLDGGSADEAALLDAQRVVEQGIWVDVADTAEWVKCLSVPYPRGPRVNGG